MRCSEVLMSRINTPPAVTVKPAVNVYTGLAALSALAMLFAMVYAIMALGNLRGWF